MKRIEIVMFGIGESSAKDVVIYQDKETTHRAAQNTRDPGWHVERQETHSEEEMTPAYLRLIDNRDETITW